MDKINDELLACYVDGIATPEEQILVRNYLAQNPEEYERVLYMMDLDREDYIGEMSEDNSNITSLKDTASTNIALSAAAFASQEQKCIAKTIHKTPRKNNLFERLNNIITEIEDK